MITAREAILDAVIKALDGSACDEASIRSEKARALIETPDTARPRLPSASVVESFLERVAGPKVGATVDRIPSLAELPEAVARFLSTKGLEPRIAVQPTPALVALNWSAASIGLNNSLDEGVAVGLARWGIAETGSLVFHSAADTPILFNFLPAVHIVAISAGTIVAHMEDYAATARAAGDPAPRNVCMITGASGTTDIEGSLVKGAHGPRDLHVVVIDDDDGKRGTGAEC
jgi:L-lactate dehydrogenase complex protein LldG